MREVARVKGLFIYPIKSCGGLSLDEMNIGTMGPDWDRRWMIVDSDGNFVTQRKYPTLAAIKTSLLADGLQIEIPGQSPQSIFFKDAEAGTSVPVRVWGDNVTARDCGAEISNAISSYLGTTARLVFMSQTEPRVRIKSVTFPMGFADSRPFLITNTASLADLVSRAGTDIPMSRFRANIVVENSEPYSEDSWQKLSIGNIPFIESQECERCIIPTIDQTTGKKTGAEPLKTLKSYRSPKGPILFGVRWVHQTPGIIRVGDPVYEI